MKHSRFYGFLWIYYQQKALDYILKYSWDSHFGKYKSFKEIDELACESWVRCPSLSTTHISPYYISLVGKCELLATSNHGSETSENILKKCN